MFLIDLFCFFLDFCNFVDLSIDLALHINVLFFMARSCALLHAESLQHMNAVNYHGF